MSDWLKLLTLALFATFLWLLAEGAFSGEHSFGQGIREWVM
ncbi:MAG: hypothetical protein ACOC4E_02940 [Patescibacteria group bacterium]